MLNSGYSVISNSFKISKYKLQNNHEKCRKDIRNLSIIQPLFPLLYCNFQSHRRSLRHNSWQKPQSLKHSNITQQKATSGTTEQAKKIPKIVGFISVYGKEISFAVRQTVRDICDGKIRRLKSDFAQRSI